MINDLLEACEAERCEYNQNGYCGYFAVTGCQRPCKPGVKCDFFGASRSEQPAKNPPKKDQATPTPAKAPKSKSSQKTVVIYANGAPAPVRIPGDTIVPGEEWVSILQGDDLVGMVRPGEVYLIYLE